MVDKIKLICNWCGKQFEILPYQYRERLTARKHPSNNFYCSTQCSGIASGKKRAEETLKELGGINYLKALYLEQQMSAKGIARLLRCSSSQIIRYLKDYGVTTRNGSQATKLEYAAGRRKRLIGSAHPHWKGGRKKSAGGYIFIYVPTHPRADSNGYVQEHIIIWEKAHKIYLPKGSVVHHLNGARDDNRPENLIALTNRNHSRRELGVLYKKRIKELEAKVKLLENTLKRNQLLWSIEGDNTTPDNSGGD